MIALMMIVVAILVLVGLAASYQGYGSWQPSPRRENLPLYLHKDNVRSWSMKSDKFLLGIIAGIVLLVVVAIIAVLTRTRVETYVADDNPAGVAHNYFLAIQRQEYERAYGYLADTLKHKPDLEDFTMTVKSSRQESALQLGQSTITDKRARIDAQLTTYSGGDLFEDRSYTNNSTIWLEQNAAGAWKITEFPYPYWGYDWNETVK